MILYPVALFQQKIVITNKILHLSPKLCLWVSFIHFTLSSVRNIFSLLLCNIQLSAQSIHLIQFNTDLWTRENKTARSTKWQEIKGILIKQTVQRHKPASHLLSAIAVTSSPNPNTESWGGWITVDSLIWSVTCAISATDPVQSDRGLKVDCLAKHLGVLVNTREGLKVHRSFGPLQTSSGN